MLTQEALTEILKTVKYPGYSRDIVSFGLVKDLAAHEGAVSLTLQLTSASPEVVQRLKQDCEQALKSLPEVKLVHVDVRTPAAAPGAAPQSPWSQQNKVPGIHRIVAVASGKGGVGKSTCSVNLACALRHLGTRVGLRFKTRWWRQPTFTAVLGIRNGGRIVAPRPDRAWLRLLTEELDDRQDVEFQVWLLTPPDRTRSAWTRWRSTAGARVATASTVSPSAPPSAARTFVTPDAGTPPRS